MNCLTVYFSSSGSATYDSAVANIPNAVRAKVQGTQRWILYRYPDFNGPLSDDRPYTIVDSSTGSVDFTIQSAQPITDEQGALTVFTRCNFGGKTTTYSESVGVIEPCARSAIVNPGGVWTVFSQPNFAGSQAYLETGDYPGCIEFRSALLSTSK